MLDKDTLYGQLAIHFGMATREQVADAVDAKRKAAEIAGLRVDVAHVLANKGFITEEQEKELRDAVAMRTGEARRVGPYEVEAKLGQGGMGAVYRARNTRTGQRVALKSE